MMRMVSLSKFTVIDIILNFRKNSNKLLRVVKQVVSPRSSQFWPTIFSLLMRAYILRKIMRNTLIIGLLFVLVACVSTQDYPTEWSNVEKTGQECPDVSGSYEDTGIKTSSDYQPSLTQFLGLNKYEADTVNLTIKNNLIEAVAIKDKKIVETKEFSYPTESAYCKEGNWVIENNDSHNREGVLGKEWKTYFLSNNSDGLVINQKQSAVGMIFFVPIAGSESTWVLFKRKPKK